jgi:hypothetical protein
VAVAKALGQGQWYNDSSPYVIPISPVNNKLVVREAAAADLKLEVAVKPNSSDPTA